MNLKRLAILLFLSAFTGIVYGQFIVSGPVIGGVTDSSARVYVRVDQPGQVRIEFDRDSTFSNPLIFSDSVRLSLDTSVIIAINGLDANTPYFYRFKVNQQPDTLQGFFTTFPPAGTPAYFTFVFGSCMKMGDMRQSFRTMKQQNPALFLQLGDFTYPDDIYGDNFPADDSALAASYRQRYLYPGIRQFLKYVPIDYVYDDHDYARNNASRQSASIDYVFSGPNGVETFLGEIPLPGNVRRGAIEGYINYFPGYTPVDTSEGLYHSFNYGNVEFIFLDNRSARSPNHEIFHYDSSDIQSPWEMIDVPGHSILGEKQMAWLKERLERSAADWKFIISGTTFNRSIKRVMDIGIALQRIAMSLGGTGSGSGMTVASGFSDSWPGFRADQDTLIKFVKRKNISNVVILTGDTHTSVMDDGTNSGIPEFNASCLDINSSKIKLYHVIDSVGRFLGQPPVLDSMWNKGGHGLGNDNYNQSFGRVEVFGRDSIRMCIVDKYGTEVACWTMRHGFVAGTNPANRMDDNLDVYPSITSGEINVRIPESLIPEGTLFIVNAQGNTVYRKKLNSSKEKINVAHLPAGLYILQLKTSEGISLQTKFLISR